MNWEYVVMQVRWRNPDFEEQLNKLGSEGWELVIALNREENHVTFEEAQVTFIFKRPVPQILVSEEHTTWTDMSRLDNVSDP